MGAFVLLVRFKVAPPLLCSRWVSGSPPPVSFRNPVAGVVEAFGQLGGSEFESGGPIICNEYLSCALVIPREAKWRKDY